MNKTIALLILGVILLAMALIMVNQYMTQPEGTAMTPGGNVPMTVAPAVPQTSSPDAVLSQLEQRAATSELAPRDLGSPASPPMPQSMPQNASQAAQTKTQPTQTMPAWASNGGSGAASGGTALTPPGAGVGTRSAETASQGSASVASGAPSVAAQVRPEQAKPEQLRPEQVRPAQTRTEPAKAEVKTESGKSETAKAETPKAAKPKGPKTIKKIAVFRMDDEVAVRVEGSEPLTYKTMHLKSPDRLVVDLDGEWIIKAPGVPENKLVSNVRIGKQNDKTRIVIDLKQDPQAVRYVKRGAEGFDVRMK